MDIERLEHEFISGYYDEDTKILMVTYHKRLSSEITGMVYAWIARIITNDYAIIARTRGCIFDFTEVKKFDLDNLLTTNQTSVSFNTKFDMRTIPIGLIVKTKPQHDYVALTMKITPDEERKKIVDNLAEAHTFINEFHAKTDAQKASALAVTADTPATTEPATTDPATTEPAVAEPAVAEPVTSEKHEA